MRGSDDHSEDKSEGGDRLPDQPEESGSPTQRESEEVMGETETRELQETDRQTTQEPQEITDTLSARAPRDVTDPVKEAHAGEADLYDIATWEVRNNLDVFAVHVTNGLRTTRTALLISAAMVLFLAQATVAVVLIVEEPVLGILGLLSVVPALALAAYFWYGDPTRREPVELLAVTFLLAILFASFAAIVNSLFLPVFELIPILGLPLFFFLVVGPIEETVKWLAIRVHAYNSEAFDTVVDGAVYGAVAGLGFAAIENVVYIVFVYLEAAMQGELVQYQYAVATAATRAVVGPGHVIFSAWAGFYLGLAKFNPGLRGPIVVKGLLIAAFIHALYNTAVSLLPLTTVTFLAFILVYHGFWFGLLYRKIARYRSLYERAQVPDNEEATRQEATADS